MSIHIVSKHIQESDVAPSNPEIESTKPQGCNNALKLKSQAKGNYLLSIPTEEASDYITKGWQDFFYNSDPVNCR